MMDIHTLLAYLPIAAVSSCAVVSFFLAKRSLDQPSRKYESKSDVSTAYDQWTDEGIVEHYWGEHIHLGYYLPHERARAYRTNFKRTKATLTHKMMERVGLMRDPHAECRVLDIGCGIGGSSRIMAATQKNSVVVGISISETQIARASKLTKAQSLEERCSFEVMDALDMKFPNACFDFVWLCESTEHIKDKERALREAVRVLRPKGRLILAAWCQRDQKALPFNTSENEKLSFLYEQWCHPPFVSISSLVETLRAMNEEGDRLLEDVRAEDWTIPTLPSWHHQILLGVSDPLPWLTQPRIFLKNMRDAWCLHRMHQAFKSGLMEYGVITATRRDHRTACA
eukprot:Selendium_serpulae@DN6321_c0_g1_i2.p1